MAILAYTPNSGDSIWLVNSGGEQARKILSADEMHAFGELEWDPGTETIVYISYSSRTAKAQFKSLNPHTGQPGPFSAPEGMCGAFRLLRDGRLLFLSFNDPVSTLYEIRNWRPSPDARAVRRWEDTYVNPSVRPSMGNESPS